MVRGRGELTPNDIEIRKNISKNINRLLSISNKKQIDIHNSTGIPKSTLTGYVKGTSTPNHGNIQKLANFFGVKKSEIDPRFNSTVDNSTHKVIQELNEDNSNIPTIYKQLTPERQAKVDSFIESEFKEQIEDKINLISLPEKEELNNYTFAAHSDDPNRVYSPEEKAKMFALFEEEARKHGIEFKDD